MTTTIKVVKDSRRHNKLRFFNLQLSLGVFRLVTARTVAQSNERFVEEEKDLGIAVDRT
jgi:hypothetical protein